MIDTQLILSKNPGVKRKGAFLQIFLSDNFHIWNIANVRYGHRRHLNLAPVSEISGLCCQTARRLESRPTSDLGLVQQARYVLRRHFGRIYHDSVGVVVCRLLEIPLGRSVTSRDKRRVKRWQPLAQRGSYYLEASMVSRCRLHGRIMPNLSSSSEESAM